MGVVCMGLPAHCPSRVESDIRFSIHPSSAQLKRFHSIDLHESCRSTRQSPDEFGPVSALGIEHCCDLIGIGIGIALAGPVWFVVYTYLMLYVVHINLSDDSTLKSSHLATTLCRVWLICCVCFSLVDLD